MSRHPDPRISRSGTSGRGLPKLDTFTRSYLETALWSTNDESDESGGDPLDQNYSISDFAPETLARVLQDTEQFQRENAEALEVVDSEGAGHDFWLTRVGSGAGFWDGDWPEPQATLLTKASRRMGHVDLYVGDDGMLYMTPGRKEAEGHARRLDKDAFEGVEARPWQPALQNTRVVYRGRHGAVYERTWKQHRETYKDYEVIFSDGSPKVGTNNLGYAKELADGTKRSSFDGLGNARRSNIARITKAYIREYSDSGQVTAYVEFTDSSGKSGRIEGKPNSAHMQSLLNRAKREGVRVVNEVW